MFINGSESRGDILRNELGWGASWKIDVYDYKSCRICLLCVERSTEILQLFTFILPRTMFFLCTLYSRGSISEHPPHQHGICRLTIYNIIWRPPPPTTSRPTPLHSTTWKLGNFVQRNFCCVHLDSPLIHIWLRPPFFRKWITRTHMKFAVGVGDGGWGWARMAKARATEKSINENCLFQISPLFPVFCRTHETTTTSANKQNVNFFLANCRRQQIRNVFKLNRMEMRRNFRHQIKSRINFRWQCLGKCKRIVQVF